MRLPLLFAVSGVLFGGCYASSSMGTDAGPSPDAFTSPLPDAPLTPMPGCSDAPMLPLDGTESIGADAALALGADSCWPDSEPHAFRRIVVPPRTGVEIHTSGVDAPVAHLTTRCSLDGEERCTRFGPSGFFSPGEGERTTYFGNPLETPVSLVVSFWWVGEGETPFVVTTRSAPVAEIGACDRPATLRSGELVPAASTRGGTYESWHCNYLPESHFYALEIPAESVALPLEGSQWLRVTTGCDCDTFLSADPLVNLERTPTTVYLEVDPSQPVGVRFEPLPTSAICDSPVILPLDGSAHEIERFPRVISGLGACAYNDPHHYAFDQPGNTTVEIEAALGTPYPVIQLLGACGARDACTPIEVIAASDFARTLRLENTSDSVVRRLLVVGSDGPAEGTLTGTISARILAD